MQSQQSLSATARLLEPTLIRRVHKLSSEAFLVLVAQAASLIAGLLLIRCLTERLDQAEFGILSLVLAAGGFANQIIFGGLSTGIARFYQLAIQDDTLTQYSAASRQLLIKAAILTVFLPALAVVLIPRLRSLPLSALTLQLSLLSVLLGIQTAINSLNNAARRRGIVAIHTTATCFLRLTLAISTIYWFGPTAIAVLIGYIFAEAIVLVSQTALLPSLFEPHDDSQPIKTTAREWAHQILIFSWPFSAWGLFTSVHLASDRFFLARYCDLETVGAYAALYQIAFVPILFATNFLVNLSSPIIYRMANAASSHPADPRCRNITKHLAVVTLAFTTCCALIGAAWHEEIFGLAISADFKTSSYLLPWMFLAAGISSTGQILCLRLLADLRTRALLTVKIGTATCGIALQWLGAQHFGLPGIVAAQVAFALLYLAMLFLTARSTPAPVYKCAVNV